MRININSNKVTDFTSEDKKSFISKKYKEALHQLEKEIEFTNFNNILISGYRGVGKTSFIKQLETNLTHDKTNKKKSIHPLFVEVNIPKYEQHSFILRKLIRSLFFTLNNLNNENNFNKELVFFENLKLLHIQTFNNVENNYLNSIIKKETKISDTEFNIKRFLSAFGLGVIGLLNLNLFNMNIIIIAIAAVWTSIEGFKLKKTDEKTNSETKELIVKSLYDDEIAEHALLEILNSMNTEKLKPVFIIDELDKIESLESIELIVGELKPLMLSGFADFIFVSGQSLFYKFEKSHVVDDALINNVFSKTFHVPLLTRDEFIELFLEISDIEKIEPNTLTYDYISSKVLNSNRIPRKFFNLIRQDMKWEKDNANIHLADKSREEYNTDAIILKAIDKFVEEEFISLNYDEAIVDFLITQLHIWVHRMKIKKNDIFSSEQIHNVEEDYHINHPDRYFPMLEFVSHKFLKELENQNLLNSTKGTDIIYYEWSEKATIKNNLVENYWETGTSSFLKNFITFEKWMRHTTFIDENSKYSSLNFMMKSNKIKDMLSIEERKEIKEIISFRNKLVHGVPIEKDVNLINNYSKKIKYLSEKLITKEVYKEIKYLAEDLDYKVFEERKFNQFIFDIMIESNNDKKMNIIFTLKFYKDYNQIGKKDVINKLLESIMAYNDQTKHNNFLVVIVPEAFIDFYKASINNIKNTYETKQLSLLFLSSQNYKQELRDHIDSLIN